MQVTRLSTKGQIILPKSIRSSRDWRPGMSFLIEETRDGILLRPAGCFPKTDMKEVAGCLRSNRKTAKPGQMRAAARREVLRRHDLGRY